MILRLLTEDKCTSRRIQDCLKPCDVAREIESIGAELGHQ